MEMKLQRAAASWLFHTICNGAGPWFHSVLNLTHAKCQCGWSSSLASGRCDAPCAGIITKTWFGRRALKPSLARLHLWPHTQTLRHLHWCLPASAWLQQPGCSLGLPRYQHSLPVSVQNPTKQEAAAGFSGPTATWQEQVETFLEECLSFGKSFFVGGFCNLMR